MTSRTVTLDNIPITNPVNTILSDRTSLILDSSWARSSFLISDDGLNNGENQQNIADLKNRYWSSADAKFTDGRLGCNIGINPKPQFTRYSDLRAKGRSGNRNNVSLNSVEGNYGMGRYYSEAIDDSSQTIYLRFGVPQFTGIISFLSRAYDADMVSLARTGRASSFLYKTAKFVGTITSVAAFPQIAAGVVLGKAASWMLSRPTSKYYTMKPTMHTYWSTVNSLVDNIAVARGLFPRIMSEDVDTGKRLGQPYTLDQGHLDELARLMPGVFGGTGALDKDGKMRSNNHYDVFSLANRAQRIANQIFADDYEKLNNGTSTDFVGYLKKELTGKGTHSTYISNPKSKPNLVAMLNDWFSFGDYKYDTEAPAQEVDPKSFPNSKDKDGNPEKIKDPSWVQKMAQHFDAEFRDGSQFAVFKVDHTGSVSESFGNSVQESEISNSLNGISSTARQSRFTFSEGKMIGGIAGDALGAVTGAAMDVVKGTLDGVTFGFSNILAGLAGAGYIDIPKYWQSSQATLPRSSYTIKLISPYGNVISQMQNIYIPLCMLLTGALPLSTGKASYTSPFLCQLFDRGRCQVKLGMIESLQITRGTSNLAFNTKGNPMQIDVTFTVADLSSIMHMPISGGGLFDTDTNLDEDNIMSDYISVLAGQDLYSQVYAMPKAKLKLAAAIMKANKLTSPAYWASAVHDSLSNNMITGPIVNVLEGLNRGSSALSGSGVNQ